MLVKTQGIVLHTTKYSETSIIARIYTRDYGLLSFIVNGVRQSGKRNRAAYFTQFSILDLEIFKRENKNLLRIKEYKRGYVFQSLPFDLSKGAIALFLVEVLNKCIRNEERDVGLYDYISEQIISLDTKKPGNAFHLNFLIGLTGYLGFYPDGELSATSPYFDLMEGRFVGSQPGHKHFLEGNISELFAQLLSSYETLKLHSTERDILLRKILEYYEVHLSGFESVRSHAILHEVLE